ncbi:MAG: hypothetical protein ABSG76_23825 [Xanthobacteraceae bacterium]|jgi:hypothetical protein
MRPVTLNLGAIKDPAVVAALREVMMSSNLNDIVKIAQNYTITGTLTVTRTLNVSTATQTQIANFIGTFITDLQKGGANRTG